MIEIIYDTRKMTPTYTIKLTLFDVRYDNEFDLSADIDITNPYTEEVFVTLQKLVNPHFYAVDFSDTINNALENNSIDNKEHALLSKILRLSEHKISDHPLMQFIDLTDIYFYGVVILQSVNLYYIDENWKQHNTKIV